MEVNLKIRGVDVPSSTYNTLVLSYGDVEVGFEDNVVILLPRFHDTIVGETKILLMKNSFPWASCSGVVMLNNSFFRSGEEGHEHSVPIFHSKYSNRADSYDFQGRETIGRMYYEFSRRMCVEDRTQPYDRGGGFVQRMFGFFFSAEKAGIMLNIKKLIDYVNSGSHGCRLNVLFGGVLVERYVAELNERFTKDIDLVLEEDHTDVPDIFRSCGGPEDDVPSGVGDDGKDVGGVVGGVEIRRLRSRTFRIVDVGPPPDNRERQESEHVSEILSSNRYRICSLNMLQRLKRLFYFTMGSYANSWPSMFISSQRQVGSEVPGHRRAVLEILGIDDEDLLDVCLEPSETVQHVVFYDKIDRRMVVSFKGSTNSEDTIQDIDCEYTEFYDGFVHNGFKRLSVMFIEKHLSNVRGLLERLGTRRLLLVGHSLGGAISILVNLLLKEMCILQDVSVETVAFSSPPVVSSSVARRFVDGITVINYGNDIIPRMSYGSVLDLKFLCCSIGEKHGPLDFSEEIGGEIDTVTSYLKQTDVYPKLYFPGELIHVKRVRCSLNENMNPLVVFNVVDMRFFEQIVLIKHAPKHHAVGHIASVIDEGIGLLEQKASGGVDK